MNQWLIVVKRNLLTKKKNSLEQLLKLQDTLLTCCEEKASLTTSSIATFFNPTGLWSIAMHYGGTFDKNNGAF